MRTLTHTTALRSPFKGLWFGVMCLLIGSMNAQELVAPKLDAAAGPLRIGIALPFHAQSVKANPLTDAMMDYYLGLIWQFRLVFSQGWLCLCHIWGLVWV